MDDSLDEHVGDRGRSVSADPIEVFLAEVAAEAKVLNDYRWGGWLALHAPESRVFIDGRANTVYNETEYRDYGVLFGAQSGFSLLLELADQTVFSLPVTLASGFSSNPSLGKRSTSIFVGGLILCE